MSSFAFAYFLLNDRFEVIPTHTAELRRDVFWTMDSVCLGSAPQDSEWDSLKFRETEGSDFVWGGDEFRFSETTGELRTAFLEVADKLIDWPRVSYTERMPVLGVGSLNAIELRPFRGPLCDVVSLAPDYSSLVGLYSRALDTPPKFRYSIGAGLDLLCSEYACCGWALEDPLSFLVEDHQEPIYDRKREPAGPEIGDVVASYMKLLQEDVYDDERRPNRKLLEDLQRLETRTKHLPQQRASTVIQDLVRRYLTDHASLFVD